MSAAATANPKVTVSASCLERARVMIASLLGECEKQFNRPMRVMFIAHDPKQPGVSMVLFNGKPGEEPESLEVVIGLLRNGKRDPAPQTQSFERMSVTDIFNLFNDIFGVKQPEPVWDGEDGA